MRITIYQPQYFPRLHYFNRILNRDIYVILESSQYTKALTHHDDKKRRHKSYQADTPIKLPYGPQLLTVPIKHKWFLPINQTPIDYTHKWAAKQLRTITMAYQKAPYFNKLYPQIEEIFSLKYPSLAHLNIITTLWGIANLLNLQIPVDDLTIKRVNENLNKSRRIPLKKITSDKDIESKKPDEQKKGNKWIIKICQALGATEQVHGETSKAGYMDLHFLKKHGIKSVVQNWQCHQYPQQFDYRIDFLPNLSIMDLLFNVSQKSARSIIFPG